MAGSKGVPRRAPDWLYDGETPAKLIRTRMMAATPKGKTIKGVADAMGIHPSTLGMHIKGIEQVADGTGLVDTKAERDVAKLFLSMWRRNAPTAADRSAIAKGRARPRRTRPQVQRHLGALEELERELYGPEPEPPVPEAVPEDPPAQPEQGSLVA